jgi:hypothetical protein
MAATALYLFVAAMLIAVVFRRHLGKLTAVLAVMSLAAVVMALRDASGDIPVHEPEPAIVRAELDRKPNIYLLIADGYASFAYMRAKRIDVAGFRGWLDKRGFQVYDDTFSNYHATADSMLAMLTMQHHHYRASKKSSEVIEAARKAIGGSNDLVQLLGENGFQTHYVHQSNYLLLQGCTADSCFPRADEITGARVVLREILPRRVAGRNPGVETWPMTEFRREISAQLETRPADAAPQFRYIHMFVPGHVDYKVIGRCDEATELKAYRRNVAAATRQIESIAGEIVRTDPGAVIVIAGDHGPFITNRCKHYVDIDSLAEYRDRVGILMAIRWPDGYDGRFDARIRTNVNVFRYVLASLMNGRTDALGGHLPDDVYVRGDTHVLKILDDGEFRIPPARVSASRLGETRVADRER